MSISSAVTYSEIVSDFQNWAKKNLENYMQLRYENYEIVKNNGLYEGVFISEDEIDSYWEENKGYQDLFYMVHEVYRNKNKIYDGMELSFIVDDLIEQGFEIGTLDDMIQK